VRVVILQPGYLPWLGFFDQMDKSDVFIMYDDVQYDKHGWRNRNRIKTAQGAQWLTVPVLIKGQDNPLIKEVLINNRVDWRRAHLKSVQQSYSRAPFFDKYFAIFEDIYSKNWKYLVDVDMAFIFAIVEAIGLTAKIEVSSSLGIVGNSTQRLVDICLHFVATDYLTGDSAKDYLDESLFSQHDIKLEYHHYQHPRYNQLYGEFIPYMSVVDLVFNHGESSLDILTNRKSVEEM